jgi:hypothetical protein
MSFYSGRHGSLIYLDKPVAKVRDWTLDYSNELLETTTVANFAPTYIPGQKSAEGAATLLWYRLDYREVQVLTQFDALINKLVHTGIPSTADRVKLSLAVGKNPEDVLTLNAYLTSASMGSTSGEVSSVRVAFRMTGDLGGAS